MKRAAAIALLLGSSLWICPVFGIGAFQSRDDDPSKAQITGTVASTANGLLLARARVFLRSSGSKPVVTVMNADDYGHFLFKGVEAGTYQIVADKPGFFADAEKTSNLIEVKERDRIQGLVIRLTPFAAVSGRIVNEHDDPVQDAQVRLLSREYLHGREFLNPAGIATTDDRGEYRIFGVRPANYYLVIEYDVKSARKNPFPGVPVKNVSPEVGYPPLFYPLTSDLRQAQRIAVTAGAELRFDFAFVSSPSVSMEGRVVNGVTGEPAKNPSVVVYWGDKITGITRKVDLAANGEFKVDGIEPGPYTVIASMSQDGENYSDFRIVEVGLSGLRDVDLALMPDFKLNGQVRFENPQESVPNKVSVEFMPLENSSGAFRAGAETPQRKAGEPAKDVLAFNTKLHPGDRYRVGIINLPQDYYLKSVLIDGHEVSPSDVAIHGNNSEMVLVASPAGGHIEGMVRNRAGQPVAGQVILTPDADRLTPEMVRSAHADTQGRFVLRGVTPGSYELYAWEQLDINELLGHLDALRNFATENQFVHVEEGGTYTPELKVIVAAPR